MPGQLCDGAGKTGRGRECLCPATQFKSGNMGGWEPLTKLIPFGSQC